MNHEPLRGSQGASGGVSYCDMVRPNSKAGGEMKRNIFIRFYRRAYERILPEIWTLRKSLKRDSNDINRRIEKEEYGGEYGSDYDDLRNDLIDMSERTLDRIMVLESIKLVNQAHSYNIPVPPKPTPRNENENWRITLDGHECLTQKGFTNLRKEVRTEREARYQVWRWASNIISLLLLVVALLTYFEAKKDRIAADTAFRKAEAVEQKITDMVLNQVVLSEFMQEGIAVGGKFILDSEVQSSIDSILALTIPKPMVRQEWSERLVERIADARVKREEMRKKK